jgi:hypothetical protein
MLAALGFEEAGIVRRLRWYASEATRRNGRPKIFDVTPRITPENLFRAHVVQRPDSHGKKAKLNPSRRRTVCSAVFE